MALQRGRRRTPLLDRRPLGQNPCGNACVATPPAASRRLRSPLLPAQSRCQLRLRRQAACGYAGRARCSARRSGGDAGRKVPGCGLRSSRRKAAASCACVGQAAYGYAGRARCIAGRPVATPGGKPPAAVTAPPAAKPLPVAPNIATTSSGVPATTLSGKAPGVATPPAGAKPPASTLIAPTQRKPRRFRRRPPRRQIRW